MHSSRYTIVDMLGSPIGTVSQCRCCGEQAMHGPEDEPHTWRCDRHQDRNPCVVEGCSRTAPAKGALSVDDTICSEHWRRYVPAASRDRRLYNAHRRKLKKLGWEGQQLRSFLRFWDRLVAKVRVRSTIGVIDHAEIAKMFGWDPE